MFRPMLVWLHNRLTVHLYKSAEPLDDMCEAAENLTRAWQELRASGVTNVRPWVDWKTFAIDIQETQYSRKSVKQETPYTE